MKEKRYRSNWIKAALTVAAIVLFTVAFGCGVKLLRLMEKNHYTFGESRKGYASSKIFAEDLLNDFEIIVNGLAASEMLVEKTSDGEDLLIDLQAVLDSAGENYAYGNVSGLAYTVADLKKWAQDGWEMGNDSGGIIVCHQPDGKYVYYHYNEFARMFMEDKLKFVVPDMAEKDESDMEEYTLELLNLFRKSGYSAIPSDVRAIADAKGTIRYVDFWNYGDSLLKEKYAPVGAKNLLDVVNKSEFWNGRLSEAMNWLTYLLEQFAQAQMSAQMLEAFREGDTNIAYLVVDQQDWRMGTNRKAYEEYDNYEQSLADLADAYGAYAVIQPSLAQCRTTLNASVKQWQQRLGALRGGGGNYIYALGVDTSFPVEDGYADKARDYNQYAPWVEPLLASVIGSLLLFAVCLAWLTVIAGRQTKDDGLHLCFFDNWYLECAAFVSLGCAYLLAVCGIRLPFGFLDNEMIAAACLAAAAVSGFLVLYLSIARRVKAKILWRTTLLRFLLLQAQKFFRLYTASAPRMLKATLAVCCYFLLMLAAYSYGNWNVYFVILLVCCLACLVFGMRRISGQDKIAEGVRRIADGEVQYKIAADELTGEQQIIAEYINRIGDGLDSAVESSVKNERIKTELITNVSHDIKTPLTSIINYVDLLKRENFEDPKVREYIQVLEKKTARLKTLTEDVVEASKISTGNITLEITELDFLELIRQVTGEFREKFDKNSLAMVVELPEHPVTIRADGRRMWRVLENVFNNAAKYAMPGTRVYVDLEDAEERAVFSIKNISTQPLNFSADELTERFIRGDVARNTEGSGLGLSIAKSLTNLQGGEFQLFVDGDLFRVSIVFPVQTRSGGKT